MIRINLLPVHYRRGHRISVRVLATAVGSAIVVCAAVGWFSLVYFGELGELETQHQLIAQDLEQKQQRAAYYDKLETNRKDYLSRVSTIQEIGKSRRLWSKFVDELLDVVNNDGNTDRHLAWFDGLNVSGEPKRGATVNLPGAVQGSEMNRIANLHEDIGNGPFWADIQSMSDPGGKLELDKTREPQESFRFTLQLQFKPPAAEAKK